jgi:hypothetical protein
MLFELFCVPVKTSRVPVTGVRTRDLKWTKTVSYSTRALLLKNFNVSYMTWIWENEKKFHETGFRPVIMLIKPDFTQPTDTIRQWLFR